MRETEYNVRKQIAQILVHIDNVSYEALLNMPSDDRELLVKAHNVKIEKIKGA